MNSWEHLKHNLESIIRVNLIVVRGSIKLPFFCKPQESISNIKAMVLHEIRVKIDKIAFLRSLFHVSIYFFFNFLSNRRM